MKKHFDAENPILHLCVDANQDMMRYYKSFVGRVLSCWLNLQFIYCHSLWMVVKIKCGLSYQRFVELHIDPEMLIILNGVKAQFNRSFPKNILPAKISPHEESIRNICSGNSDNIINQKLCWNFGGKT
ncbi:hypothetical protein EMCRGX_G031464 [Ephydatia muelleri]